MGDKIGSGSYGTVHFLLEQEEGDRRSGGSAAVDSSTVGNVFVGKRPWTQDDIRANSVLLATANDKTNRASKINGDEGSQAKKKNSNKSTATPQERAERCLYYWQVENHCFTKLPAHPQLPPFYGRHDEWMVFGFVGETTTEKREPQSGSGDDGWPARKTVHIPAPTLQDLMDLDRTDPQQLRHVAEALGTSSHGETLDRLVPALLTILQHVHKHRVVHRDVKPGNLLVHNGTVLLIDFGSAADLDPSTPDRAFAAGGLGARMLLQPQRRVGLEGGGNDRVAVSPMYAAPEVFISLHDAPTAFDVFSAALVVCQLLFGYLEDRVDAGFHQQLEESAGWDINVWLNNELGTKLRPAGLDRALEYLGNRPGMWRLLGDMLSVQPTDRPTATQALKRWQEIMEAKDRIERDEEDAVSRAERDGPFFAMVLEALETCEIPSISRPLHFVATFARSQSLGLILSEMVGDGDETQLDDADDDGTAKANCQLWKEATKDAMAGEVFVKEIVPGSQADQLRIIEVGDRLAGIGELPFIDGGFERAVEMLQDQPRAARYVRLHFDRLSVRDNMAISLVPTRDVEISIADYGAWSSRGRRKAQEDAFVLHEIHDARDRSVLVAGVMDGHGGTAASSLVARELPGLLANQLVVQNRQRSVTEAMEGSWRTVCALYQQRCEEDGESCVADYDPREGTLMAETGSKDLTAGTTCSTFALDETTSQLTILNCGDSRSVVVSSGGSVRFATADHTPRSEERRLMEGVERGLAYSLPQCRLSRWWLKVGDYEYSVGRSLEGPLATSKGIVSDPDVTTLAAEAGEILVSGSDGLWDVMDSSEVAMDLHKMRHGEGMSARDAARALCSAALRKGTTDNVSAVVVFL